MENVHSSKIYLCTFGTKWFTSSRWRLQQQAYDTGWFRDIFVYGAEDLTDYNHSFESHQGAGYYWWKPVIIKKSLEKIQNGDILLYLDAGFSIFKEHNLKFYSYLESLKDSDVVGFQIASLEKHFTKRDLFRFLDIDSKPYTDSYQMIGGMIFFKKTDFSMNIVSKWEKICTISHMVNDDPSYHDNYNGFIKHRHDQSVISLLVKKYGGKILPFDPTDPHLLGKSPMVATRIYDKEW